MAKVILLLIDAVGFDAAVSCMGTLEGYVEAGLARRWKMRTELPSLSAPLYETIHTGTPPVVHGIRSNDYVPLSKGPHVFGAARAAGKTTGAVAHYFFSELYNRAPYDARRDMEVDDDSLNIQHGRFYSEVRYTKANLHLPSEFDLFTQVTVMIDRHAPDYILLHAFAPDAVGHIYGGDSAEYRHEIWAVDNALAETLPIWREAGYRVLLTSDHGMTSDGRHGGTSDVERFVPFYDVGNPMGGADDQVVSQLCVAPTSLALMGVRPPREMTASPLASA
ncbi:MAG TPA: nucleotide pyrophosphatase [Verrucomicrobiales bacterium]|nr:nucleotide pyrophosphatase [Verrucomicrobiales bacterium]